MEGGLLGVIQKVKVCSSEGVHQFFTLSSASTSPVRMVTVEITHNKSVLIFGSESGQQRT
jgi:hypothetical protein